LGSSLFILNQLSLIFTTIIWLGTILTYSFRLQTELKFSDIQF